MSFLSTLQDLEKNPALRSYSAESYKLDAYRTWVSAALKHLTGNVDLQRSAVHVAGTKGKGSTSALVESLLRSAGLGTGLYTSPHQTHFGERYRVQGSPLSPGDFEALGIRCLQGAEAVQPEFRPTVFELLTLMAFVHFTEAKLDAEVYEVGLGGRLDCTNIITPSVTIITSIGLDHTQLLGDTHEKIAREKAGILKKGIPLALFPVSTDERMNSARREILFIADSVGAPLLSLPQCVFLQDTFDAATYRVGQQFRLVWPGHPADGMEATLALAGEFQLGNLALALAAAEEFLQKTKGRSLRAEEIKNAVEEVYWPGRLQVLRSLPAIVVDSAHCPLSARLLGENLRHLQQAAPAPYVLLWGMQRDKNHRAFLENLLAAAGREAISRVVCYTLPGERGAPASMLYTTARECVLKCMAQETLEEAFRSALTFARPGSVLAAGSVYPTARVVELHQQLVAKVTKSE